MVIKQGEGRPFQGTVSLWLYIFYWIDSECKFLNEKYIRTATKESSSKNTSKLIIILVENIIILVVVSHILFIFTLILGDMIQFDDHIFQLGLKPPTSN